MNTESDSDQFVMVPMSDKFVMMSELNSCIASPMSDWPPNNDVHLIQIAGRIRRESATPDYVKLRYWNSTIHKN